MSNRQVTARFDRTSFALTAPLYQYDYGQILIFDGIALPASFEVQFANTEYSGETLSVLGTNGSVDIPDELLQNGDTIFAWVYLHETEDDGETVYKVKIPVRKRPEITGDTPTPVEQNIITQTVAALNTAIEHYPQIIGGEWYVWDATEDDFVGTGVMAEGQQGQPGQPGQDGADGQDGYTPVKGVDYFDGQDGADGQDGYTPVKGVDYFDGQDGQDGADGYTPVKGVDYFDGEDGQDGVDGQDGYTPVKGVDYFDGADGQDGQDGADGESAYEIAVDHGYVGTEEQWLASLKGDPGQDGQDGAPGQDGQDGSNGADGVTFTPSVSSAGVISWTNDGQRQNPSSVDLVAAVINALPSAVGVSF